MSPGNAGLVQPLFDGSIDIVGDVHGEIEALQQLLGHLGYQDNGKHPEGRRLVFIGDLADRGPDSPAVVRLVSQLVREKLAQCMLGNHATPSKRPDPFVCDPNQHLRSFQYHGLGGRAMRKTSRLK
jgi:hypothetical protein